MEIQLPAGRNSCLFQKIKSDTGTTEQITLDDTEISRTLTQEFFAQTVVCHRVQCELWESHHVSQQLQDKTEAPRYDSDSTP